MAVSLRIQSERARAKWDAASTAFCDWAIANGYGNIRRNELEKALADVPEGLVLLAAENAARKVWDDVDSAAVAAGHAWRGSYGSVNFYSAADARRFAAQHRRVVV